MKKKSENELSELFKEKSDCFDKCKVWRRVNEEVYKFGWWFTYTSSSTFTHSLKTKYILRHVMYRDVASSIIYPQNRRIPFSIFDPAGKIHIIKWSTGTSQEREREFLTHSISIHYTKRANIIISNMTPENSKDLTIKWKN